MQSSFIQELFQSERYAQTTQNELIKFFAYMSEYEQKHNVDFANASIDVMLAFLNSRCFSDYHTAQNKLQIVRKYVNGVGGNPDVNTLHADDIDLTQGMRQCLISDISEIYSLLNMISAPDTGDYLYPASTFAWMGVELQEVTQIKSSQVDLLNGTIIFDRELVFASMNQEMRHILQLYRSTGSQKQNNRKMVVPDMYEREEFIFKMLPVQDEHRGSAVKPNEISRKFLKIRDLCEQQKKESVKINYSSIMRSGKFAKLYFMEQDGVDWQLSENGRRMQQVYQTDRLEAGYLRKDYEAYKKAFGLK